METLFVLLAACDGNLPVTGGFPLLMDHHAEIQLYHENATNRTVLIKLEFKHIDL